jgi:hypothetical protein
MSNLPAPDVLTGGLNNKINLYTSKNLKGQFVWYIVFTHLFLFCLLGLLKIGLRTAFAHISHLVEQYYECIQG